MKERSSIGAQIIPVGSEVIIDNIEQHRDAKRVCGIDHRPQIVGRAVALGDRIGQDAVIAPVARAAERRDGHQLERGHAERGDLGQACGEPGETAHASRMDFHDELADAVRDGRRREFAKFAAFGGTRNWGYDGVLPYAVAESYGTPDDLRAMVDAAHALGVAVLLDVVYNHFGPDGNYLGAYAGSFFHKDVDTPWGGAVAVDVEPVARYFIDNALMWLTDYRIDGLRFDAVHAIDNDRFLDAMAAEIRATVTDRPVHLVLENERNDADRLRPGGYDAQWNDDFHNVLHVLLTGETSAYYADFADRPAERLARCLGEGFIYQGEGSANHDGRTRGTPSAHLSPTAFVSFLQNHDQIGNRALGERLTLLTDHARLRAATALLLLCPQIPLLFMGDETGSETPFLFFTDFHDELAGAVRDGRRREFAKFAAFADESARAAIPDPNALATFSASVPRDGPEAGRWRTLYSDLLALRHRVMVPRLRGAMAMGAEAIGERAVVARWRMGDRAVLTIALNLGDEAVVFPAVEGDVVFADGATDAGPCVRVWLSQ